MTLETSDAAKNIVRALNFVCILRANCTKNAETVKGFLKTPATVPRCQG